jgi:hypothetical protein
MPPPRYMRAPVGLVDGGGHPQLITLHASTGAREVAPRLAPLVTRRLDAHMGYTMR